METSTVQLEINTLLHKNGIEHNDDIIKSVINPSDTQLQGSKDEYLVNSHPLIWRKHLEPFSIRPVSTGFLSEEERDQCVTENFSEEPLLVKGADAGDFPTEYEVNGLSHDELPVIGTYVHRSIIPGFKYRVHVLGRNRYLFQGRSLYLQSIGRGYGKRITFEGDSLNNNDNYFYSDTNKDGFGFRITALETDDAFVVLSNEGYVAGQGNVKETLAEKELYTSVESDGSIVKHVAVRFTCEVKYGFSKHGLVPLCSEDTLEVFGTAVVTKTKGSRKATTKIVQQISLPNYGLCNLAFGK